MRRRIPMFSIKPASAVGPATINGAVSALRFLFSITLKRPEMALGLVVMQQMADVIRGCPAPYVIDAAGHFVQEWGDQVARAALAAFAAAEN